MKSVIIEIKDQVKKIKAAKYGLFKKKFDRVGPAWIENKISKLIDVKKKGDIWEGYYKGKHLFNYDYDDYALYSDLTMIQLEDLK